MCVGSVGAPGEALGGGGILIYIYLSILIV